MFTSISKTKRIILTFATSTAYTTPINNKKLFIKKIEIKNNYIAEG
jgi:hypothetical protein